MKKFNPAVCESLNYYVYSLADPRAQHSIDRHFYIGKGCGNRVFDHLQGTAPENSEMAPKLAMIEEIRRQTGSDPEICIIAHGLAEKEALRLEAKLIGIFDHLTNLAGGHYGKDFWLAHNDILNRYDNPIKREDLPTPVMLVSLNGGKALPPYPNIAVDEPVLKKRTIGDWTISEKNAERTRYVFGVYQQLVRCVYKVVGFPIERLPPSKDSKVWRTRWLDAIRDKELEDAVRNRMVLGDNGEVATKFGRQAWRLLG